MSTNTILERYMEVEVVETECETIIQEVAGPPGADGQRGADGDPGVDGTNGQDGQDGDEVELQVADDYIQWKLTQDADWINLIAVADLKGDKGEDGDAGQDGD